MSTGDGMARQHCRLPHLLPTEVPAPLSSLVVPQAASSFLRYSLLPLLRRKLASGSLAADSISVWACCPLVSDILSLCCHRVIYQKAAAKALAALSPEWPMPCHPGV